MSTTKDPLGQKAIRAMRDAVRQVLEDHKRAGLPVVVWKNGKVAKVSASQLLRKSK